MDVPSSTTGRNVLARWRHEHPWDWCFFCHNGTPEIRPALCVEWKARLVAESDRAGWPQIDPRDRERLQRLLRRARREHRT